MWKLCMSLAQEILTPETAVLVETGDSWFNGQKLKLPDGCLYACFACCAFEQCLKHALALPLPLPFPLPFT